MAAQHVPPPLFEVGDKIPLNVIVTGRSYKDGEMGNADWIYFINYEDSKGIRYARCFKQKDLELLIELKKKENYRV